MKIRLFLLLSLITLMSAVLVHPGQSAVNTLSFDLGSNKLCNDTGGVSGSCNATYSSVGTVGELTILFIAQNKTAVDTVQGRGVDCNAGDTIGIFTQRGQAITIDSWNLMEYFYVQNAGAPVATGICVTPDVNQAVIIQIIQVGGATGFEPVRPSLPYFSIGSSNATTGNVGITTTQYNDLVFSGMLIGESGGSCADLVSLTAGSAWTGRTNLCAGNGSLGSHVHNQATLGTEYGILTTGAQNSVTLDYSWTHSVQWMTFGDAVTNSGECQFNCNGGGNPGNFLAGAPVVGSFLSSINNATTYFFGPVLSYTITFMTVISFVIVSIAVYSKENQRRKVLI
jgi:hypothetical protein